MKIHFPPPYEREIWHYGQRDHELVRRAVHEFNQLRVFRNLNINEGVSFFNKTILNEVSNFIPHETIICDDRDPSWKSSRVKNLINDKEILYKKCLCSGKNRKVFEKFKVLQNKIVHLTNDSRVRYYTRICNKLNDSHVSPKAYWSFLKIQKNSIILPLFYENRFVMDFTKKGELFNSFFAKQCTVINSGSSLPSELLLKIDKFLSNITFFSDDILKIIQNLDSQKAHGHDRISIQMLKICGPSICKPVGITFKLFLESGIFPLEWKKGNVPSVHKKMTDNL